MVLVAIVFLISSDLPRVFGAKIIKPWPNPLARYIVKPVTVPTWDRLANLGTKRAFPRSWDRWLRT